MATTAKLSKSPPRVKRESVIFDVVETVQASL